jgi:hypothetical protein
MNRYAIDVTCKRHHSQLERFSLSVPLTTTSKNDGHSYSTPRGATCDVAQNRNGAACPTAMPAVS